MRKRNYLILGTIFVHTAIWVQGQDQDNVGVRCRGKAVVASIPAEVLAALNKAAKRTGLRRCDKNRQPTPIRLKGSIPS